MKQSITKSQDTSAVVCPFCRSDIISESRIVLCGTCKTPHHEACWDNYHRCSVFGCSGTKRSIDRTRSTGRNPRRARLRTDKIGRNDFCSCGSGRKYKNCCLPKTETHDTQVAPSQGLQGRDVL